MGMTPETVKTTDAQSITMALDVHDLRLLRRALRYHLGKLARRSAKEAFVPEPGHYHVAERTLARGQDLLSRLESSMSSIRS